MSEYILDVHGVFDVGRGFCMVGFPGRVYGEGAIDDTQDLVHNFGLAGKRNLSGKDTLSTYWRVGS